ncbi:hypothetical protein, partial [Streptomyces sp. NPDC048606]|uniref:hypothetical protein n=1 Tax=Streptomyces sp. NPDC048606 TaxID=3154726 RepID=UPI0034456D7F
GLNSTSETSDDEATCLNRVPLTELVYGTALRRIKEHVEWVLGTAAAIATIAGLYFIFNPPDPPGPTMNEWRINALSVCSRYGSDGITKFNQANKSQERLDDDARQGKPSDKSLVAATGQQWEEAGNAIAEFLGYLREIKQPSDQAKQINETLDLGDDIATTLASSGRAIRDHGPDAGRTGLDWVDANGSVWREKMAKLGICGANASPSHSPS